MSSKKENMVKVAVLCGFLGAGKTTSLSYLLEHCPDSIRVGVIANDVAKINIDAALIKEVGKNENGALASLQLENGCACCTGSEDLIESVERLMKMSEDNSTECKFDYIVIETTGVAEAGQMKTVLKESPSVKSGLATLAGVVTVLDSNDFLFQYQSKETLNDRPDLAGEDGKGVRKMVVDLLVEQVEGGDIIVLNKTDLIENSQDKLELLLNIVESLNPRAPTYATKFGSLNLIDLLHELESCPSKKRIERDYSNDKHVHHHHDHTEKCSKSGCGSCKHDHKSKFGIDSFVFKSSKPFHGPALAQHVLKQMAAVQQAASFPALERFISENNDTKDNSDSSPEENNPFKCVLRSKGFLFLGGPQSHRKMYWSHAGRHFSVAPKGEWGDELPQQELVFIGVDMDQDKILDLLGKSLVD